MLNIVLVSNASDRILWFYISMYLSEWFVTSAFITYVTRTISTISTVAVVLVTEIYSQIVREIITALYLPVFNQRLYKV